VVEERGYLKKRALGGGILAGLKAQRRYFVLKGRSLAYFSEAGQLHAIGSGTLRAGQTLAGRTGPKTFEVIGVEGFKGPLVAECASEDECKRWVDALEQALKLPL
jgi:hypothetical protein